MLRGHAGEPTHVLVLRTLGTQRRRGRLARRGARNAPAGSGPAPVSIGRATLIDARRLEQPGERWLAGADLEQEAGAALAALERVLHAHRLASTDAATPVISRSQALVIRVGVGDGDQVADGRWAAARELAPPTATRRHERVLRPQERLTAVLSTRDVTLACELLTLRARADADAGRWREAAFQLRVALEAAIAELQPWSGQRDIDRRIEDLREAREPIAGAANAALQGGLDDAQITQLAGTLERVEAALRARTAAALDQPDLA